MDKKNFTPKVDDPPNSRLFVIGSKLLCEEDFRTAFEEYGNIQEIWMVKDRLSGESKGVTYIKYSKTSEAAAALEAMNGKCIGKLNRSIRVMIAANRDQGSKRESNEEEKTQRLFVVVPKAMTDEELYDTFKSYGDIDYATVIRDKETRESKGFAYVKYFKFSHAAAAFEKCDRTFRPVFAEPRRPNSKEEKYQTSFSSSSKVRPSSISLSDIKNPGYTKLVALVSPEINQDQLWRLFDIVPGLDYCQLRFEGHPNPNRGIASIVYKNSQSAAYAKEKLHGLEYPPGSRLIVKPDTDESRTSWCDKQQDVDFFSIAATTTPPNLFQVAGISSDSLQSRLGQGRTPKVNDLLCSVSLPDPQPLASSDEPTVSRCFIVCSPSPLPNAVLRNIFSRFGHLIDVYILHKRTCGFAKYAKQESAEAAIQTLHGAEVDGIRIKVLKAEEKQDGNRKRQRSEENM